MIPVYNPLSGRGRRPRQAVREFTPKRAIAWYLYLMFVLLVVNGAFIAVLRPAIQILPDTR